MVEADGDAGGIVQQHGLAGHAHIAGVHDAVVIGVGVDEPAEVGAGTLRSSSVSMPVNWRSRLGFFLDWLERESRSNSEMNW